MKQIIIFFTILLTFLSLGYAVQDLIPLQGSAYNIDGSPVEGGDIQVFIYDAPVDGNLIYDSGVDFDNKINSGQYDILLGSSSVDLILEFGEIYYIDISINTDDIDFDGNERQMFQSTVGDIKKLSSSNIASGENSFAGGIYSNASGQMSFAIGEDSKASGIDSFVGGKGSEASGLYSFAFGTNVLASGQSSVAFGENTISSGQNSFAIGEDTYSSGWNSFAGGFNSNATDDFTLAFGNFAVASNYSSIALGINSVASGKTSFSFGYGNKALGESSSAFGVGTTADGLESISIGFASISSGYNSIAIGRDINVTGDYSIGIGLKQLATKSLVSQDNTFAILGGNSGFGTATPQHTLEVSGTVLFENLKTNDYPLIVNTNSASEGILVSSIYDSEQYVKLNSGFINIKATSTGSGVDNFISFENQDHEWSIGLSRSQGMGSTDENRFYIGEFVDSLYVNRFVIQDTTGNVGFGVDNPQRTVHIKDVMRLEPISAAPENAQLGDLYVNDLSKEICFFNGNFWEGLTGNVCEIVLIDEGDIVGDSISLGEYEGALVGDYLIEFLGFGEDSDGLMYAIIGSEQQISKGNNRIVNYYEGEVSFLGKYTVTISEMLDSSRSSIKGYMTMDFLESGEGNSQDGHTLTLEEGTDDSFQLSGVEKIINVMAVFSDSVLLDIDGYTRTIDIGNSESFNGDVWTLDNISYGIGKNAIPFVTITLE